MTSDRFGKANAALIITASGRWRAGGAYTTKAVEITGNSSRTISYWTKFSKRGTGIGGGRGNYTQSTVSWGAEGALSLWGAESTGAFWFNASIADLYLWPPKPAVPFYEWKMVTFVYSGIPRTAVMYVNGVAKTNFVPGYYRPNSFDTPLNTIATTARIEGGKGDMIDEVRIYNRALSDTEVRELYYAEAFTAAQRTFLQNNVNIQGHASLAQ